MNDWTIFSTLLSITLASSFIPAHAAQPLKTDLSISTELAKVGEKVITREDVIHMIQIEKFYKSPELYEADALFIIMQDAIAHEIAHSVGVDVSPSETQIDSPFIDQFSSRSVENKKEQGAISPKDQAFHVDHGSYAQLYIVPKMIDRKLRDFHSNSSQVHAKERARIEEALQLALSGKSFADVAKEKGLSISLHELENNNSGLPDPPKLKLKVGSVKTQKVTLINILDKLQPGSIHPNIIEDNDSYSAIRLIDHTGQHYSFETIEIGKSRYEDWLKDKASTLPITISNDALKKDIKQIYKDANWVERL